MLTIFEGSNRVGKTSIIKKLDPFGKAIIINNRWINDLMVDRQQESLISAMSMLDVIEAAKETDFILDRFHLSEYIYGIMQRGYTNEKMFSIIDERLASWGPNVLLVLVHSDYMHVSSVPGLEMWKSIQRQFNVAYDRSKIENKMVIKLEALK